MDNAIETLLTWYKKDSKNLLELNEVDALVNIIRLKLNLHEENITVDEYNRLLDDVTR